jgi:hypothetical protein
MMLVEAAGIFMSDALALGMDTLKRNGEQKVMMLGNINSLF